MRRGVKPRFTMARIAVWLSPSSAIRFRAVVNSNGLRRTRQTKRARKRTTFQVSGGRPSFPWFIRKVNIAREEKSSGLRSTYITSS